MKESKITATDRLRREGRWEEASMWRDEKRGQLRQEGQSRADANAASWQAMIDQFPPMPEGEEQQPGSGTAIELLDINPDDSDDQTDLVRDALWVYANLCRNGVQVQEAPSLGAWGMLTWARTCPDKFFQFFQKVMPQRDELDECNKEKMAIAEIQQMIAEVESEMVGAKDSA